MQEEPTLIKNRLGRDFAAYVSYDLPGTGPVKLCYSSGYPEDFAAGKLSAAKFSASLKTTIDCGIRAVGFQIQIVPNPEGLTYPPGH
ncbi:MAG: hypothetical protein NC311_10155, partial [Muribaculaceae bacterium]|nr:hypothetical protein [Muribaculaceae bacterium]